MTIIKRRPNINKLREQAREDFEMIEAFDPVTEQLIEVETIIADRDTLLSLLDYIDELEQAQEQLKAALEEISFLGMNKPFPLDGFGEVANAIAQAKYDLGEIAREALQKAKNGSA